MPALVEFRVPHDTSLFTQFQLQPRFVLWTIMTGWARWLESFELSFPRLISEHRIGVVVLTNHLRFARPYGFFDGEAITVRFRVEVRGRGRLLGLSVDCSSAGELIAETYTSLRTVHIADVATLGAVPCGVPDLFTTRLGAAEVPGAPERHARLWSRRIEADGKAVASRTEPLHLGRSVCEAADQWCYIEVPNLAAGSREALCLQHASLRRYLRRAVESIDVEFTRSFAVFEPATISTRALDLSGQILFEHQILDERGEVHALVIEAMGAGAPVRAPTSASSAPVPG